MQTLTSQVINLDLLQKIEIIKGLEQGYNFKQTILKYQILLEKAKAIHKSDSLRLIDKQEMINLYKSIAESKEKRISNNSKISETEKVLLKDKLRKRFSLGLSAGQQIIDYKTFETDTYFGVGINFTIFRF